MRAAAGRRMNLSSSSSWRQTNSARHYAAGNQCTHQVRAREELLRCLHNAATNQSNDRDPLIDRKLQLERPRPRLSVSMSLACCPRSRPASHHVRLIMPARSGLATDSIGARRRKVIQFLVVMCRIASAAEIYCNI